MTTDNDPVIVSLDDLEQGRMSFERLEAAFGPQSLGIIIVKGLPERFAQLRHQLLSYSSYLANLPPAELEKLEDASSHYLVGWSCGKETLGNGRYDTLKGSYYANSVSDPSLLSKSRSLYPNLPEYTADNLWPSEAILSGFRRAFEDLCGLIISTAVLVARACDRYAQQNIPDYRSGLLEHMVKTSVSTKARLLHYFPSAPSEDSGTKLDATCTSDNDDDWCGTHLDHGCLTGLTSAMFIDEHAHPPKPSGSESTPFPPLPELPTSPDPLAGLYIRSRAGAVTKVSIPRDCLAFQTGEALERITRGRFRAVPHFVRGVRSGSSVAAGAEQASSAQVAIARNTLAVFTQPNLWEVVDERTGLDFAGFAKEIVERNH